MPRILPILAALIILSVIPDLAWPAPPPRDVRPTVHNLVEHYISCFNRRDADGILDLYSQDARIVVSGLFSREWVDVDEYASRLQEKLIKYDEREAYITDFEVERLEIDGDTAQVDVSVHAEQGVFSMTRRGSFELAKEKGDWKIIVDEF